MSTTSKTTAMTIEYMASPTNTSQSRESKVLCEETDIVCHPQNNNNRKGTSMEQILVQDISVANIQFNPKNAAIYQKVTNDNGSPEIGKLQGLVVSLNKLGQQEPITVVPDGDGNFRVISGARRLAAAQILKWKTLKAIILPNMNGDEEDVLIVTHNLTREKTYAEKLAEFKVYKSIYCINDGEIEKEVKIDKDEETGREELSIKDFISSALNMGSTKLRELLYVEQHQPGLIKDIDDGKYSVHSAYEFVKKETEQAEEPISLKSSEPDFDLLYDSDRQYADTIVATFSEKVRSAKVKDRFSLVSLLRESINQHEGQLDSIFAEHQKTLSVLFETIDTKLQANDFTVVALDENNKEAIVDLETLGGIEREAANGIFGREALKEMRELVLKSLYHCHIYPQIGIDGLSVEPKPFEILKGNAFEYLTLLSMRYTLVKESKSGHITPTRRRQLNHGISKCDRRLRIYLRIICGLTEPFVAATDVATTYQDIQQAA